MNLDEDRKSEVERSKLLQLFRSLTSLLYPNKTTPTRQRFVNSLEMGDWLYGFSTLQIWRTIIIVTLDLSSESIFLWEPSILSEHEILLLQIEDSQFCRGFLLWIALGAISSWIASFFLKVLNWILTKHSSCLQVLYVVVISDFWTSTLTYLPNQTPLKCILWGLFPWICSNVVIIL